MDEAGAFPSQSGGSLDAKLEALLADIDTSVNKAEQRAIRNERAAQRGPGGSNKLDDDPFAERVTGRHEAEDAVDAVADAIDEALQDEANPTPDAAPSDSGEDPAGEAVDAEAEDEWPEDEWAASETLNDNDTLAADLAAALEAGTSDGVDPSAATPEGVSPPIELPEPPPKLDATEATGDEVAAAETAAIDETPEAPTIQAPTNEDPANEDLSDEDPFANARDNIEPEGIIEIPESAAEPAEPETIEPHAVEPEADEPEAVEPEAVEPDTADVETGSETGPDEAEPTEPASADEAGGPDAEESTPPVDLDALRAEISGAIDEIRAEADAEIAKGPPPLPDPPPIEEPSASLEDELASVGEVAPVEVPEAPAPPDVNPEPSDSDSTSAPSDEIADLDAELASEAEGTVEALAADPWEGDTDSPEGAVVGVDDDDDDTLPPPAAARGGAEPAAEPPVVETASAPAEELAAAATDQNAASKTAGPVTYGRWPSFPPKPDWPEAKGKAKALTIAKRHALWLIPPIAGWTWHHTKRLAKKAWEAARPTTIKVLEAAHKPLEKLDPKLRSAVGWIGVYTCFLATCLWVFVFFVQKPTMPQTDAVPTTLDAPDSTNVAAATE